MAESRAVRDFKFVPDSKARDFGFVPDSQSIPEEAAKAFPDVADRIGQVIETASPNQATSMKERFLLKNFLDDPNLQAEYLKRRGYDVEIRGNELFARPQGSGKQPLLPGMRQPFEPGSFKPVDPRGFDPQDITDVLSDVGEAIVTGVAAGPRAVGLLGGPMTGGLSTVAGAGLGALATGGYEATKQGAAVGLGLRDTIDPKAIATKAGLSGAFNLVGGGLLNTIGSSKIKPNVEEIISAGKSIGAKVTPGMITADGGTLSKVENSLTRQRGAIGGSFARGRLDENLAAIQRESEGLVSGRSGQSAYDAGVKFENAVTDDIAKRLAPAEALYEDIAPELKNQIVTDSRLLRTQILDLKDEFKYSPQAQSFIQRFEDYLPKNKIDALEKKFSISDLKEMRSQIFGSVEKGAPTDVSLAAGKLYGLLSEQRNRAVEKIADPAIKGQLQEADNIFRGVADDIDNALFARGKRGKGFVEGRAGKAIENISPEKRVDAFLPFNDVERVGALRKLSPEGADALLSQRIEEITQKATSKAIGGQEKISPNDLITEIDKLTPEMSKELFGENAGLKLKALRTFIRNIPGNINPSGTSDAILLSDVTRQLKSLGTSGLYTFLQAQNSIYRAGGYATVKEAMNVLKENN